ncbi:MAG TPA: hypothetical protein VN729_07910 [Ktedonobacteraceae bacterium]|nr:hypothetical protein [Ktedonobacteraceae bacterium]
MAQLSRFARSGQAKYTPRLVLTTRNRNVIEAFYRSSEDEAPLDPGRCAMGMIQHPATNLYQVWISTNGLDVICLSAHRRMMRAETVQRELKVFLQSGDLYRVDKADAFFAHLHEESDEEPRTLPDNLVRQIGRAILRRVVDGPR